MHLKNWSLLYPDQRTPVLSPAYDLVATLPYLPNDQMALTFGGSRNFDEITIDQIRHFADTAQLPTSAVIQLTVETIERTITAWNLLEEKALLPSDMLQMIDRHLQAIAKKTRL